MKFELLPLILIIISSNRAQATVTDCNENEGCGNLQGSAKENGVGTKRSATSSNTPQTTLLKVTNISRCGNTLHFCSQNQPCEFFLQHVSCRCLHDQVNVQSGWNNPSENLCSTNAEEGFSGDQQPSTEYNDGMETGEDADSGPSDISLRKPVLIGDNEELADDIESLMNDILPGNPVQRCPGLPIENHCQCNISVTDVTSSTNCPVSMSSSPAQTTPPMLTTPSLVSIANNQTNSPATEIQSIIDNLVPQNISDDKISDENLINILSDLSSLLSNTSFNEDSATSVFNFFGYFSSSTDSYEPQITTEITKLTDVLLNTMTLRNGSFELRTGNISVAAMDLETKIFNSLTFSPSTAGINSSGNATSSFISLPSQLLQPNQRIAFTGYDNAQLFRSPHVTSVMEKESFDQAMGSVINSAVVGATVNRTTVMNLKAPVKIGFPLLLSEIADEERENMTAVKRSLYNPRCVFFDYSLNNGLGDWSSDGCVTIKSTSKSHDVECLCNHLTNFAVLMSVETKVTDFVLDVLTYLGCIVSIIGLLTCIITYSIFRHLRKHKSQQILLNFSIALCGVYVVYLLNIAASLPANQAQCTAGGVFLYFFTTSTFCWMLIEILHMYMMFVNIWNNVSHITRKACLFGWGFPIFLSTITLIVHFSLKNIYPDDYGTGIYPIYRNTAVCWMTLLGFRWAFLLPMGILFLLNLLLFVVVLYHVTCKRASKSSSAGRSNTKKEIKAREHIMNAVAIILLSGPTWVVGFLINIDPDSDGVIRRILSYVFVIINVFQGLWIFIVFTLRPQAVRTAWKGLICGKTGLEGAGNSSSGSWVGGKRTTNTSVKSRPSKTGSFTEMRYSSCASALVKSDDDSGRKFLDKNVHEQKEIPQIEVVNHNQEDIL